jgi:glycerol uptake facilitator-like aquaporin
MLGDEEARMSGAGKAMREQVSENLEEREHLPAPVVGTLSSRPQATVKVCLAKRLFSEGLGTAFLLATVVGSGIMGERLAGGNVAIALLANSLATGAALIALILTFGPISGAHFNAVVTLAMAVRRELPWRDVVPYIAVQVAGALLGVWATHYIFELPVFMTSHHARTGGPQWVSEGIATLGLLSVIFGCAKARPSAVPYAVGGYITAAYWFTSSTSFANPVVTIARAFSDTFAGIRPQDVAGFIVAQLVGGALATVLFAWLVSSDAKAKFPQEEP